ncbi:MAG: TlpA family protein disulfide reductase [Burkholderiales bacterium]|nr:TlpA family protein disulfide reductase [Burkholderiales bacterium]
MPKRFLIAAIVLLVALAGVALWLDRSDLATLPLAAKSHATVAATAVSPGALYSAKFSDLQGNVQGLGQWDRKLLIVNFWATWCGPCKEEIPILVKIQEKFSGRDVQIVGIAVDSSLNVANYSRSIKINYPIFPDEVGAIAFSKRLGNRLGLLPHTVVIAPGGTVIYNKLGVVTEAELVDIIAKNAPI